MNRTHFLGDRRDSVFNALIEGGQVVRETIAGKTKRTTIYRIVRGHEAFRPKPSTVH